MFYCINNVLTILKEIEGFTQSTFYFCEESFHKVKGSQAPVMHKLKGLYGAQKSKDYKMHKNQRMRNHSALKAI